MAPHSPTESVRSWLESFGAALEDGDIDAALMLFGKSCFWRDMLAFTWNITTAEGEDEIRAMLGATLQGTGPASWRIEGEATEMAGAVNAFISFETGVGRGRGHLRLVDGKCFTLLTALYELKGFEEKVGTARPMGPGFTPEPGQETREARVEKEHTELGRSKHPFVVIVGGAHSGVMLAARLRVLDVPTIVVEKGGLGDSWRNRYSSLHLHTPGRMDAFPHMPYPDSWPDYPSKDEMADWIEAYAKAMQLNIWTNSAVQSSQFNEETKEWAVTISRPGGHTVTLRPKHLVLSTGLFGDPRTPAFEGSNTFQGLQYHATCHRSDARDFRGRKCVVLGSNTSGHDICRDLWEKGADVTMVQRSPTLILRSETLNELYIDPLYSEGSGFTQQQADLLMVSTPFRLLAPFQMPMAEAAQKRDADLHDALRKVGFQLHFANDGSGIIGLLNRRSAGYYYEIGASRLIADRQVALRKGSIKRINERSVVLTDGTELPADVIVYATGYGPLSEVVARVTSPEIAAKVGPLWGYGSGLDGDKGPWEGELRGVWKPTRQEGLWFHIGGFVQTRFASLMVALQLKARFEGLPTPVYGLSMGVER